MGFIKANRKQQNFLGYSIDDFAKTDSKCRFIVKTVSRLNLSKLMSRYSDQGGDAYAPDMMLALWFYAYSQGITRTRKLEELCTYDTRYIYLSCNLRPDHTTLSRFRQHHIDLLADYFVEIVMIAEQEGYLGLDRISIDGTKINASCSRKQSIRDDALTRRIEAVRRDIADYMLRCDCAEQFDSQQVDLETLREEKQRLEELEKKLVERQRELEERKKTLKPEHRKKHQINIVEPEARFMPKIDGPAYNAAAAVDNNTQFIVANDVTNDPNDQKQFSPMHQKIKQNLPKNPQCQYTADSGFHSLDQLEYIEENKIDAVIADPTPENRSNNRKPTSIKNILEEQRKVKRSDFTYHAEGDYYSCPGGDKLIRVRSYRSGNKRLFLYRASKCISCPIFKQCVSSKKNLKQIHRDHREELAERMSDKLNSVDARDRLKERDTTVEPAFGNIKQNLGFRRFNLRGLEKVKGEFTLMCIAHNLNILFKMIQNRRCAEVMQSMQIKLYQHITFSKNILLFVIKNLLYKLISPKNVNLCQI